MSHKPQGIKGKNDDDERRTAKLVSQSTVQLLFVPFLKEIPVPDASRREFGLPTFIEKQSLGILFFIYLLRRKSHT